MRDSDFAISKLKVSADFRWNIWGGKMHAFRVSWFLKDKYQLLRIANVFFSKVIIFSFYASAIFFKHMKFMFEKIVKHFL